MRAPLNSYLFECSQVTEFRFLNRNRPTKLIRSDGSLITMVDFESLPFLPQSEFQVYVRRGIVVALVSDADLRAINIHIEIESEKAGIQYAPIIREFASAPVNGFINPKSIRGEVVGSGPTVSSVRRALRERLAPGNHTRSEWLRIMARDGYRCLKCGSTKQLSKDHVQPIASGGSDDASNLQTLCSPCNSAKGNRTADYRIANGLAAVFA